MEMVVNGHPIDPPFITCFMFMAVLLHAYLFGIVSQQVYTYWSSGFQDSKRVKVFVITQFLIVIFQSIALWQMAWSIFITNYGSPLNLPGCTWEALVQDMCGNVLVLSANVFLAIRIHSLTRSRLQSGLVLAFSTSAFLVAIVTIVMSLHSSLTSPFLATPYLSASQNTILSVWHGLQAIAECLITIFLARALLKSRSGLRKSDNVVNYLIRQVIQTGFLATLWVTAELGTWFLLPRTSTFVLFDVTLGLMHTQEIYATLLSRVRLREVMANSTDCEIMFSPKPQGKPDINGRQWGPPVSIEPNDTVIITTRYLSSATADTPHLGGGTFEHDDSEITYAPVTLPDAHF